MYVFRWRLWFSWRLWNWGNQCDLEDFDIDARIMKREDFCFRSFIFSFLSHRKHRTVKGVEVILRKHFPSDAQFKILHLPNPFEWIHWKFHISSVKFLQWQRRRSSGLWGICSDWGVRNSPVRIAYTVRNMVALRNSNLKISDRCWATR